MIIIFGRLTFNAYICSIKMKQLKQNDMTTLRNTEKNLFASIVTTLRIEKITSLKKWLLKKQMSF